MNKKANMTEIWFPRFIATYNTDSGQNGIQTLSIFPIYFIEKNNFSKNYPEVNVGLIFIIFVSIKAEFNVCTL